ncbi:MAG: ATPase [Paludibacteraceae bacterium]|nr:ATPase [Paludibacteraceae bacterium]
MILIADSGSTSTNWVLVEHGKSVQSLFTPGINPFYQTPEEIAGEIATLTLNVKPSSVKAIYFYGAGCVADKIEMVKHAIAESFTQSQIYVESDLVAAARGLLQHDAGIACILGTGSNSCFYDGKNIVNNVSPLGFILGDEGSGAVLGKKFIADCLKNQLPEDLKNKFLTTFGLTANDIINHVYRKPFPNRYLAQFTPFLAENMAEPAIYNLIFDSFTDFFVRNVMQYPNFDEYPVSFVGSIAYYFKDILEVVAFELGITLGEIKQSPLEGLVAFHSTL